jgi:hypothetical protein
MNSGLWTSVTEASGALRIQLDVIRLCGGPKATSASATDWIEEAKLTRIIEQIGVRKLFAHSPRAPVA